MQSADVRLEVIGSFLKSEITTGKILGPVEPDVAEHVQVNRFGLIPKRHQPGNEASL